MKELVGLIYISKYVIYAALLYLAYTGYDFYVVPLMAVLLSLTGNIVDVRLNILMSKWHKNGFVGVLQTCPIFYVQDLLTASVVYALALLVQKVIS